MIETGLGGRLDATNVLAPALTITTDISRDHVEILGRSLRRIAREKAGIIKPGVPHLVGALPDEALTVMAERCRQVGAPLHRLVPRQVRIETPPFGFAVSCNGCRVDGLQSALPGRHQVMNAALVVRAAGLLRSYGPDIPDEAIRRGLAGVEWPGRFQVWRTDGGPTFVLDVAHNAAGMAAFVDTFLRCFPGRRVPVVMGFVKRKEHQRMVALLGQVASAFHVVPLATRRSMDLDALIGNLRWPGVPVRRWRGLGAALREVTRKARPADIIIVVGSHYLVGEFLRRQGWS